MNWTHIEDTKPKARKRHFCYLCGIAIEKGQFHIARTGVESTEGFATFRMHLDCEPHTRKWNQDDWECHDASDFREWLERKNVMA